MITTSKKLKIDYAPLDIILDVKLVTPNSGLIQTYNVASNEYEPDRTLAAQTTIILPIVRVSASDGSWKEPIANEQLSNVAWLVNGNDISSSPLLYTLNGDGPEAGKLFIESNVPAGTTYTLQFKATLLDSRKKVSIPIQSDLMYLTCTTKAEESLSVSVTRQHFAYDIMHDKLAEFDYKVCKGIVMENSSSRNACKDGNEYLAKFPYIIKYGDEDLVSEKTITLKRFNDATQAWETCSASSQKTPEVITITKDARGYIIIDCRLLSKVTRYRLVVTRTASGKTYEDYDEFTVRPCPSRYDLVIRNDSNLNINKRIRHEDVIVTSDNIIKTYPAAFLNIEWGTDRFGKTMNCGTKGILDTWRKDEGNDEPISKENESLSASVSHEPKGMYYLLTNGKSSDQFYQYSDGATFIID